MAEKYKPYMAVGPGEVIKDELEARNWSQEDFAEVLGKSPKEVSKLVNNQQSISLEMAKLLSQALGPSPQFWLNLNANYRLRSAEVTDREKNVATRAEIYKHMPVKEMVNRGWLAALNTVDDLVKEVKGFWGTASLDFASLERQAIPNLRKSEAYHQFNKYYALTWYRMAKRCSRVYQVGPYSKESLSDLCRSLHEFTTMDNGVERFIRELSRRGVKFFVLPHLSKTYIDGASFWDGKNPVVVYTNRHDRTDNFWFTVAHEIAHILLHLRNPNDFFIDNLEQLGADITYIERQANDLASETIRASKILQYFEGYKKYVSRLRVEDCAMRLQIQPALVVGVLQHHAILSRANLNRFKALVSDLIPEEYMAEQFIGKITAAV